MMSKNLLKKIGMVLMVGVLSTSVLVACDDEDTSETVATVATVSTACSDSTFASLQDSYADLVEAYNTTKGLYESDLIAKNQSIENALNEAADIINEMGTIKQSEITEDDAYDLLESMSDLIDVFSALIDKM